MFSRPPDGSQVKPAWPCVLLCLGMATPRSAHRRIGGQSPLRRLLPARRRRRCAPFQFRRRGVSHRARARVLCAAVQRRAAPFASRRRPRRPTISSSASAQSAPGPPSSSAVKERARAPLYSLRSRLLAPCRLTSIITQYSLFTLSGGPPTICELSAHPSALAGCCPFPLCRRLFLLRRPSPHWLNQRQRERNIITSDRSQLSSDIQSTRQLLIYHHSYNHRRPLLR
uniref:Secreted protein n=1 Tax=Plectus sambesii TaxID=2011161 RepID=A0A914WVE5_9BILA